MVYCSRQFFVIALMLCCCGASWAGDVSDWKFEWKPDLEKERHKPLIAEYSKRADEHLAKGNFWRARYNYKKLYKVSRSLHNRGNAKLAIAVAQYGAENYEQSLDELMVAISDYANFIPYEKALALEYTLAKDHFDGKTDLLFSSMDDEAIKAYQHIQTVAPFSKYAEQALFSAGMLEIENKNLNAGTVLLTKLLNRYPQSQYRTKARLELTYALLLMAQVAEGDPLLERRARTELKVLSSERLNEDEKKTFDQLKKLSDDIEVKSLLFQGEFYQRTVHWNPDASRRYLEQVVKFFSDHPGRIDAEKLLANLPSAGEPE